MCLLGCVRRRGGAAWYCVSAGWPCLILLKLITSCCLGCSGAVEVGRGVREGRLAQPASALGLHTADRSVPLITKPVLPTAC